MTAPRNVTPETQTYEIQPKVQLTPEEQRQLDIGRAFIKEYEETFRALAKS